MPVYEYGCPDCLKKEEVVLPMVERDSHRVHSCGAVMERLVSLPAPAVFPVGSKDKISDTLNGEEVYAKKDRRPVRSKRSQNALASGLDYVRPLEDKIFAGFG